MGWRVDSELGFHVVWFPEVGFNSQNAIFISSNLLLPQIALNSVQAILSKKQFLNMSCVLLGKKNVTPPLCLSLSQRWQAEDVTKK